MAWISAMSATEQHAAWKEYEGDFNSMSDEEIEQEVAISQNHVAEHESWLEAVASWKAAGRPRRNDETDQ